MIKNTLYAEYIKEREGAEIIENEFGFITFKVIEQQGHIKDTHVKKDAEGRRRPGVFKKLADDLEALLVARGCHIAVAKIHLEDPACNETMRVDLSIGFRMYEAHGNTITLVKKLGVKNG